jgi:hypothetical protein
MPPVKRPETPIQSLFSMFGFRKRRPTMF